MKIKSGPYLFLSSFFFSVRFSQLHDFHRQFGGQLVSIGFDYTNEEIKGQSQRRSPNCLAQSNPDVCLLIFTRKYALFLGKEMRAEIDRVSSTALFCVILLKFNFLCLDAFLSSLLLDFVIISTTSFTYSINTNIGFLNSCVSSLPFFVSIYICGNIIY